jgi:hypothetical protein
MKQIVFLCCLLSGVFAKAQNPINSLLDQWHEAAATANFEAYFSSFAENAYFIGTDASERWNIPQFKTYAKPSFEKAPAWIFTPVERNIEVSPDGKIAWFDEVLTSTHLGVCRGSGVLVLENDTWKIKHYVLSLIVPNQHAREVAALKSEADQESLIEFNKN